MEHQLTKHSLHLSEQDQQTLHEELRYLYMRLRQIGYNGDCAYEKKLACFYDLAITRCKQRLSSRGGQKI